MIHSHMLCVTQISTFVYSNNSFIGLGGHLWEHFHVVLLRHDMKVWLLYEIISFKNDAILHAGGFFQF